MTMEGDDVCVCPSGSSFNGTSCAGALTDGMYTYYIKPLSKTVILYVEAIEPSYMTLTLSTYLL